MRMTAAIGSRASGVLAAISGLRAVIGLTVVVGTLLASGLVYLEESVRMRSVYENTLRTEAQRLSALMALALRESMWELVPKQAESVLEAAFVNPDVLAVDIRDQDGHPFAQRVRPGHSADEARTISFGVDILREQVRLGRLTLTLSTEGYAERRQQVLASYFRAIGLMLIGSLVFIYIVMHLRFVKPAERLLASARRLADGDLKAPIHARYHDELGAIADSLEQTRRALLALVDKVEQKNADLHHANETLEQRVDERTRSLQQALETLNHAQDEIVQVEKLASLGRVVAGVAHELNTPIGNALVVASTLADDLTALRREFEDGTLRRSTMQRLTERSVTGLDILSRSLESASRIVGDFKQVAVDQTSDQRRRFDAEHVTREVLSTLNPTLRRAGCEVVLHAETGIECDSFPGAYGQVLNNLVMNALMHGYPNRRDVQLQVYLAVNAQQQVQLTVQDEGVGMSDEVLRRIFDPFFTTRLGRGGSGLGMNIVQGIVVRILGGQLTVHSVEGQGTTVTVQFPKVAPSLTAEAGGVAKSV